MSDLSHKEVLPVVEAWTAFYDSHKSSMSGAVPLVYLHIFDKNGKAMGFQTFIFTDKSG
jgi:hypothetical protein